MKNKIFFFLFLIFLFSNCKKETSSPNIILFFVDDLGWQDVIAQPRQFPSSLLFFVKKITTPRDSFSTEFIFQLSPPIIQSDSVFFEKENRLKLILDLDDVHIHYTLDGSEPTKNSPLFDEQIILKESASVKAKAFHHQYLPSEMVEAHFIKISPALAIKKTSINRIPHENYQGKGATGLTDRKKGTTNFRTAEWMGFAGGNLEVIIEFEKEEIIGKVTSSLLSDADAWIFMPQAMIVYSSTDGKKYELKSIITHPPASKEVSKGLKFIALDFPKTSAKFVKVEFQHFPKIPDWHPGKGTPPWLFIDEILVE